MSNDWKNWWVLNSWAPPRLVRSKFKIPYDTAKAYRCKIPKPPEDQKCHDAWQYYVEEEKGIDINKVDAPEKIRKIKLKNYDNFKYSDFIRSVLKKRDDYNKWMKKHRPAISFLAHNIYPGEEYCKEHKLFPERFPHSQSGVEEGRIVEIVAEYYLYKTVNLSLTEAKAKELFIRRYQEADFLSRQDLINEYGINGDDINRIGVKKIKEKVADKFKPDLGLSSSTPT